MHASLIINKMDPSGFKVHTIVDRIPEEQVLKENLPKFFVVDVQNLKDLKLFGSINWLKVNFEERFLNLGFSVEGKEYYFYY